MVDGLNQVVGEATAVGATDQADVPLSPPVQRSLLINMVVNSSEPGVFMDCGWRGCRELVRILQAVAGLVHEGAIGENKFGSADETGRGTAGECLRDGTHLRGRAQGCLLRGR